MNKKKLISLYDYLFIFSAIHFICPISDLGFLPGENSFNIFLSIGILEINSYSLCFV